jgi:hypothetical protein
VTSPLLQQRAEADRREVDPPIQAETAMWSNAGQLDWWMKDRQEWWVGYAVLTVSNDESGLLIFDRQKLTFISWVRFRAGRLQSQIAQDLGRLAAPQSLLLNPPYVTPDQRQTWSPIRFAGDGFLECSGGSSVDVKRAAGLSCLVAVSSFQANGSSTRSATARGCRKMMKWSDSMNRMSAKLSRAHWRSPSDRESS